MRSKDLIRQLAVLVVIPLGIAANYFTQESGNVAAITRATEPLLGAAGWAFSIWGLIFLGQLAYALYQVAPTQKRRALHRGIGWMAVANAVLAASWLFAFSHHQFTLAMIIMVATLANLVVMDGRIHAENPRGKDVALVRVPFALNLGWICAATVLNVAQFLHAVAGYDGAPLSPLVFAHVLVVVAALVGAVLVIRRDNAVAGLAVAWGLVGVAAYEQDYRTLTGLAAALAVALVALAVLRIADRGTVSKFHMWR